MSVRDIVQAAAGVGGGGAYIEDVFSTYLYAGNGSTQTITNGIDLDGEGGLVWLKDRGTAANNYLFDTERGALQAIYTDNTLASGSVPNTLTGFNSDGFAIGSQGDINTSARNYVSWTFRKAPKFFDCVTYTGTGSAQNIAHNLGADVGCLIVKRLNTTENWTVWHRGIDIGSGAAFINLNLTSGYSNSATRWNNTAPTDSVFTVGTHTSVNASGSTYVAYLFAHDAGGFGDDGEQNVISCGSYTGNAATPGPTTTLGYEPQWVLIKRVDSVSDWTLYDNMRGLQTLNVSSVLGRLYPNLSSVETDPGGVVGINATGFQVQVNDASVNASGGIYIYIAIRRGPMKTPTAGTEVFAPTLTSASPTTLTTIVAPDTAITRLRGSANSDINSGFYDRLRGKDRYIVSSKTAAEATYASAGDFYSNMGFTSSLSSSPMVYYTLKRAPGFFDVVCYKGNSSTQNVTHNLGVVPEMMIVKCRSDANAWPVYHKDIGNTKFVAINWTDAEATLAVWGNTTPTSTVFTLGNESATNFSGRTYIAYLFATLAGVSKVGSYSGTGTVNQIDCGFTSGARFVMIKSSNTAEDWYVWDSARGIVSGNDPYFIMNNNAAEVTGQDRIDPYSAGFELSGANQNTVGRNYIFLAIA